ncbi:hypothetical protein H4696_002457 [Amycolatopsis lexingtonensis]|uniref:Uncharacterized protein n=1 Tax=Amycolatopsis lexingtonensis TaxID=218822 RepID=A0ABR9HWR8_9PSEU|nr:hypothetical protein [Amycolatopsis lexingtonensis]MBE1495357.1 hypothetical protein [Amycolatopsis lexingtonensis]
MAAPVTESGSVECRHQGAVALTAASDRRLTVKNGKVVLFDEVLKQKYLGCTASTPPGTCASSALSPPGAGRAARLTVGGAAVLLDSLTASSLPSATPVQVAAGQSVLTAS